MNHVTQCEFIRCANGCGTTYLAPWTTCPTCNPRERALEEQRWRASAEEVRALCMDHYCMSMLAIRADGSFVLIRDAYNVQRDGSHLKHDELIRDLAATKKELTEVLAENARMRRRLEKKR